MEAAAAKAKNEADRELKRIEADRLIKQATIEGEKKRKNWNLLPKRKCKKKS